MDCVILLFLLQFHTSGSLFLKAFISLRTRTSGWLAIGSMSPYGLINGAWMLCLSKWCLSFVTVMHVHLLVADLILEIGSLVCFGLLFLIFVRAWIIWFGILLLMGSFLLNLPTIIGFFITPDSLLQLLIILGCGNLEFLKRRSILCNSFVMIAWFPLAYCEDSDICYRCHHVAPHTPRLFLS